ncbi:uncharacterized protein LOC122050787 [Zingiber officinale]|uniref:J domain-containing protein n=1 Tax=Zingiber officinale TaxID=94328 RepID=A0A8J5IC11_ZINOF|nr:uncharacterized protein LOC122050787 [Zingiber officinale]KAG6531364.1 hypothetical protein ZIOFF_005170 [Zingiber officinale]
MGRKRWEGAAAMAASSPPLASEKKPWWLSNKKVVDKYLREARSLIATQEQSNVVSAVGLLDAALALSPRMEAALELKARSLLFLRRFREVADMLQDYIPSYKADDRSGDGDSTSSSLGAAGDHSMASSAPLTRERANLLSPGRERSDGDHSFRCFSVSDLKRRVLAGMSKSSDREGQWRYLVLGQACCHLGMMENAMVLLQTGRRLASAAFRRESVCWSDDSFGGVAVTALPPSEMESASLLLSHIKLILRRRAAAVAALDAGLPAEAIRHFTKVLDSRRGLPGSFAAGCLIGRAAAHKAAGRLADAIADCNLALALDPSSISALRARADLFEAVRALTDCLHDLEHLKLLHEAIIRDRKLPGPRWRPHHDVRYRDIPANLPALTARIQHLRGRIAAGEANNVDYHTLLGVRRGCTRTELGRAHLLLTLKHKPEKAVAFVERLEFADDHRDFDSIRDQARMSASILYRMLQKGYASVMTAVVAEEVTEKQRAKEAAAATAAAAIQVSAAMTAEKPKAEKASVFQGVFCRDMAVVGSMLSHRSIPVKYEALSC